MTTNVSKQIYFTTAYTFVRFVRNNMLIEVERYIMSSNNNKLYIRVWQTEAGKTIEVVGGKWELIKNPISFLVSNGPLFSSEAPLAALHLAEGLERSGAEPSFGGDAEPPRVFG